ncbi:glycosyltransferase family 4 protein [Patescibacteria group bacterium]|nr:glycosyltransferase family 4 protein [Patescibacteria group bacterium]
MHVAMIGQKGIPARMGGIERHVEELSTRLTAFGVRVTVYTRPWYTKPSLRRHQGVSLISLPSVHTKYFDAISHTFRATVHALRSDADVLHYHGVGPALLSWIPRLFAPSKRVVVTFHCIDRRHEKWGFLGRLVLGLGEIAACKFAHETIVVSRTLQHYVENLYRSTVRYVPNGVAAVERQSAQSVRAHGLEPGSYILVVTRFVRHKGVHTMLAAWERIQHLPSMRGMRLVLVGGTAFSDSYVEEIQAYAGKLERVHLLGVKEGDDLAALYQHARLFVHASVSEGLPIVVLEAMVNGTPVLASDIPEHMELVAEHGWSFAANNPQALAEQIRFVLKNRAQAETKAARARRFVLTRYHWDDIVKETGQLYESVAYAPKKIPALAS